MEDGRKGTSRVILLDASLGRCTLYEEQNQILQQVRDDRQTDIQTDSYNTKPSKKDGMGCDGMAANVHWTG